MIHHAAALDASVHDAPALPQDRLPSAEIDISRVQIMQAFMVSALIVAFVECPYIGLRRVMTLK